MNNKSQYSHTRKPGCRRYLASHSNTFVSKLMKLLLLLSLCGFNALSHAAAAPAAEQADSTTAKPLANNQGLTTAMVRKIDIAQAKITLKHAAITSIGMPAMTMVFKVAHPSLLTGLNVNDEVLFSVEKQGSALVVTQIKQQKAASVE